MTKPAAISAQLVDVRNIGMHKCIKLTLHVPAEQAPEIMAAFGWPTATDPVPVALARLEVMPDRPAREPDPPARAHIAPEKRLVQQAGMCCRDPVFRKFMVEEGKARSADKIEVTEAVRFYCGVDSRAEIIPGTPAGDKWDHLWSRFQAWRLAG